MSKYLGERQPFSAISTGGPVDEIQDGTEEKVVRNLGLSCEHPKAINVGFLFNDNQVCSELSLFATFQRLHNIISAQVPRPQLDEQVAASVILHQLTKGEVTYLDERYNMRVRRSPSTGEDFRPDIANIHYITKFKPWKPLSTSDVRSCGKSIHPIVPVYRNLWIRYAQTLKYCDGFLNVQPFDELQMLGVIASGTRGVQQAIKAIRAEKSVS